MRYFSAACNVHTITVRDGYYPRRIVCDRTARVLGAVLELTEPQIQAVASFLNGNAIDLSAGWNGLTPKETQIVEDLVFWIVYRCTREQNEREPASGDPTEEVVNGSFAVHNLNRGCSVVFVLR
jgi:hypothetical protein